MWAAQPAARAGRGLRLSRLPRAEPTAMARHSAAHAPDRLRRARPRGPRADPAERLEPHGAGLPAGAPAQHAAAHPGSGARRSARRAAICAHPRALRRLRHRRPLDQVWRRRASSAFRGRIATPSTAASTPFLPRPRQSACFYLTDYLVRHFERLIIQGLGLDRHPELLPLYFGNYEKLVYLAPGAPDPQLEQQAKAAAAPRPRLRAPADRLRRPARFPARAS